MYSLLSDIVKVLPFFCVAIFISLGVYFIIYKFLKDKREAPTKKQIFFEYVLTGWLIMFLIVTQFLTFFGFGGMNVGVTNFVPLFCVVSSLASAE